MKKIFIVTLAFLMAVTMGTSLAQIGPAGGGPVGPAGGTFKGGTISIPIKAAVSADCTAPAYAYSTSGYDNTGVTDITGSENVNVCVNGASIAAFNAASTVFTHVPTLPVQNANVVFGGPASGAAAAPTFRSIVDNDVPDTITVSNYLPLAGGTMVGNLIFTDNTYDIGASGATRPRTGYFGTDVNVGGDVNITDDLSCNQATATVTAIGAALDSSTNGIQAGDGLLVQNTTAAADGAQQYSPTLRLDGQGWKTAAAPASQQATFGLTTIPTQGTTNPTGRLAFSWGVNQGGLTEVAAIASTGAYQMLNQAAFAYSSSTGFIGATGAYISGFSGSLPVGLLGAATSSATVSEIKLASYRDLTHEGARIVTIHNNNSNTDIKASVGRMGAYYNAYASGNTVHGSVPALAANIVTVSTDDANITVEYECIGNQQAGTPAYWANYSGRAYFKRVDGTLTETGETQIASYENDADCACSLSATDGATDYVTVTFNECVSTGAGSGTMNWKIWAKVYGVDGTSLTGVTQGYTY